MLQASEIVKNQLNFLITDLSKRLNKLFYLNVDWIFDSTLCYCVNTAPSLNKDFYPTALKGCHGIVFTHSVWMGQWVGVLVGAGKKFVWAVSQKP